MGQAVECLTSKWQGSDFKPQYCQNKTKGRGGEKGEGREGRKERNKERKQEESGTPPHITWVQVVNPYPSGSLHPLQVIPAFVSVALVHYGA